MTRTRHFLPLFAPALLALACRGGDSEGQVQAGTDAPAAVHAGVPDVDTGDTEPPADPRPGVNDASAPAPSLRIVVQGDMTDLGIEDGMAAQTPSTYFYGLQRLELLRSSEDTEPVVIFDYAPGHVLVDMLGQTSVAEVPMSGLPDGTFTHFRIALTVLDATIDATLHEVPVVGTLPKIPLHIVYALSDFDGDGSPMAQGDAVVSAKLAGKDVTVPAHWDVAYPEPSPGATAASAGKESRVTFVLAPALAVSPESAADLTYTISYFVHDSFRWIDMGDPGYTQGAFDVTVATPPDIEPVIRFGANAYALERSKP